ncbi:MAG TPA: metallopeptidase TldD-related protein [Acidobacteriaceae bacterium]|jgi:predicted Zn-dependent protease|nr:metallopeptidase TldD-related protein [Acidobacteriaceae bacterium]
MTGRRIFVSLFALALAASSLAQSAPTRADAEKDPVLHAMLAELDRSRQQLQLQGFDKPYFIEYRIDDVDRYAATAEYGALTTDHGAHSRIARVTVRVGDYKSDSSFSRGDGALELASVENDPLAIRFALWQATDEAYKAALNAWAQKQANLKSVQTPPQADDFSHEKPTVLLEPVATLDLDRAAWKQAIVDGTGLYRSDPTAKSFADDVEVSQGSVEALVRTVYLVNSEGAIIRTSQPEYRAEVALEAQAADGMRLDRSYPVVSATGAGLGSPDQFRHGVLEALNGLRALRDAPLVTGEYHGPVLFAGNASARSFEEYFSHAVTASRPQLGSTARTTGPFASSYNTRVLPDFIKIVDDPSLAEFGGKPLLGAYKVDDEGVPAQTVTLVDSGKLVGYLLGREPVKDFPASNGHGRAPIAQPAQPHIGVLEVEATGGLTEDDLVKKLIAMGKDQGLESVYLLQAKTGPTEPRTLYRIKVADGSRELVRGARLADVDLRSFRSDIVAVGADPYVDNVFGDEPSTIIAPPLLFDDVTVKRGEEKNEKLPYYPPPAQ